MIKKQYRTVSALVGLTVALVSLGRELFRARPAMNEAQVIEVIDGDTVTIRPDSRTYRTRMVGIDAPEMGQRPRGRGAQEHLIGIMRDSGWMVFVETAIVKHDKYNRLLAYLWSKQNKLINERMVRDGYAVLFTLSPNVKYADRLARAESRARNEMKGIWGPKGLREDPFKYRERHPRKEYGF